MTKTLDVTLCLKGNEALVMFYETQSGEMDKVDTSLAFDRKADGRAIYALGEQIYDWLRLMHESEQEDKK